MILARFFRSKDGAIKAVEISGHAGAGEFGSDIVCAAASTIAYTAVGALEEICGIKDGIRIEENSQEDAVSFVDIRIPGNLDKATAEKADIVLRTMEVGYRQLEATVRGQYVTVEQLID